METDTLQPSTVSPKTALQQSAVSPRTAVPISPQVGQARAAAAAAVAVAAPAPPRPPVPITPRVQPTSATVASTPDKKRPASGGKEARPTVQETPWSPAQAAATRRKKLRLHRIDSDDDDDYVRMMCLT